MSNFNVKAIFSADTAKFMAGIGEVLSMTTQLGTLTDKQTAAMGKSFQKAGIGMSVGLTAPVVAGTGKGIKAFADYDSTLRSTMSAMGQYVDTTGNFSGQAQKDYQALSAAAKDWGAQSIFSSLEAAQAQEVLASRGMDTNQILATGPGIMALAAASQIELTDAADATGSALQQFNGTGLTSAHVADVFAQAAADSALQGMDLAEALKYSGLQANLNGVSFEETAAALAVMSDTGMAAESAGRYLGMALSKMAKPTDAAKKLMEELGISFYDSEGKMKPLAEITSMLQDRFAGLTDEQRQHALTTMFGQEAGRGMNALLQDTDGKLVRLTDRFINSEGAAQKMADTINTGPAGAFERMGEAIGNLGLTIGEKLAPAAIAVAGFIEGVVESFNTAPPVVQNMIMAVVGLVAAIGPLLLIIGTLMANIVHIKTGLAVLGGVFGTTGTAAGGLGAAFGAVAAPIALVVGGIALFVAALKTAWTNSESFRDTITNAISNVQTAFGNFSGHVQTALGILSSAFTPLLGSIQGLWNKIVGALTPAFSMLGSIVGTVVAGAFNILGPVVQLVSRVFSGLMTVASGLFSALGFVAQIVGGVLSPVFSVISIVINTVVTFVSSLITAALNLANSLLDKLAPALDFVGGIAEKVGNFFGGIGDAIGGFAEKIGLVTADTNQKVTETSNLMVTSTANTASSVSLSAEQMQANASAASAMMQNNMLHNFMTTEQGATTSAQTMKTNAVDAATGMEIGMLDAAERMRTGTTTSAQTMSTDLISAVQPAAMQLPQHFQIMADQAIVSMQNMGVTSLEEANDLVSGLGLKWEEMASWSEKDWSAVNAIVTENMVSADANAAAYSADILSGVGGDWTELAGITEEEFADMGISIGTSSDSWTTEALGSASELNTGMSAEWADLLSTTNTSMSEMESTITSGMNSVQNSMSTSLSGISAGFNKNFSTIISNTKSSMNTLKKTFLDTMKLSVQAFTADMNRIVDIFRRGFQNVNKSVNSDMMKILQSTRQTMQQMVTTIQHAMSTSVNSFRVGMNQSLSAVNSYRGSMQSAGYNLSIGLANGISSGRSVVVNAAARVAANAVSAARNQLAIRSPSRVMETIGMYFDQGFAEGIADFAKSPVQAAGNMVKDVLSAAELQDFDFAGRIGNLNNSVSRHVDHIVKDNRSSKQSVELNFTLGQRQFRAFVEDISSVQGKDIQLEELYGF